jgi:hypothetical protein
MSATEASNGSEPSIYVEPHPVILYPLPSDWAMTKIIDGDSRVALVSQVGSRSMASSKVDTNGKSTPTDKDRWETKNDKVETIDCVDHVVYHVWDYSSDSNPDPTDRTKNRYVAVPYDGSVIFQY